MKVAGNIITNEILNFYQVLLLLVVFVLRKRVAIVVQLFREAGSALLAMPCLVIQPFITYITLTGFFCIWLYVVLCLATSGMNIIARNFYEEVNNMLFRTVSLDTLLKS